MPVSTTIGTREVSTSMINQSAGKKKELGLLDADPVDNYSVDRYECGEDIPPGNAVGAGPDGKLYNAYDAAGSIRPAVMFAKDGGLTGEMTGVRRSGQRLYIENAVYEPGKNVWLDSRGEVNSSTSLPVPAPGSIIQKLGYATGVNEIEISIGEAYYT